MSLSIDHTHIRPACQPKPMTLRKRVANFFALARQRRQLAALEQHILCDIGVTPAQAVAESQKPAWDVPNHWQH